MTIGPKIKELRTKAKLTQKDLADRLNVTYQAVSRWENSDVEPSIETLKEMCNIFHCTMDELLDMEKKEDDAVEKEPNTIVEKIIVQESKPVIAVCEQCGHAIYEPSDYFHIEEAYYKREGRTNHKYNVQKNLCGGCNEIRLLEKQLAEKRQKRIMDAELKEKRIKSFVWPACISLLFFIMGIVSFVNGKADVGVVWLVLFAMVYCFSSVLFLDNNFVSDLWFEIASWGFVTLPGIIFEFSLDGLIFLIAMKIIFFLLGLALALLSAGLATIIAMLISIFVYPFALRKNLKGIE